MINQDQAQSQGSDGHEEQPRANAPPSINLPNGGGAIRGIAGKFPVNLVMGTGSFIVSHFTSPRGSVFLLKLSYDSVSTNGSTAIHHNQSGKSENKRIRAVLLAGEDFAAGVKEADRFDWLVERKALM